MTVMHSIAPWFVVGRIGQIGPLVISAAMVASAQEAELRSRKNFTEDLRAWETPPKG